MKAIPHVFSIRNTAVEAYLEPLVHEIKCSRADLLGDLKRAEKRAANLPIASMGTTRWTLTPTENRLPNQKISPSNAG